jgi:LEA14-like dessication related protein
MLHLNQMFKKIILIVLGILLLIPGVFLVKRYIDYSDDESPRKTFLAPEMRSVDLKIKHFKADRIDLNAEIMLLNHLPFDLKANRISYSLLMEGVEIMKSTSEEELDLPAKDSAVLVLPVRIIKKDLDSVGRILKKKKSDEAQYMLLLEFHTSNLIKKKWTYERDWSGAAFYLLDANYTKLKISSLKKKGASFQVYLKFENQNSFPIQVKDIEYVISVDDDVLTKGSRKGVLKFPAKKTTHVDFPANVAYRDMAKILKVYLPGKSKMRYKFDLSFTLDSDNKRTDETRTTITRTGPLEEILDFNKDKD